MEIRDAMDGDVANLATIKELSSTIQPGSNPRCGRNCSSHTFIATQDYICPEVILSEEDGSGSIRLNDFFNNELSSVIEEVPVSESTFTLQSSNNDETIEEFIVRVFKLYYPRNQRSRISLGRT